MSEDETPLVIKRAQELTEMFGNGQESICTGYPCRSIQKLSLLVAEGEEKIRKLEKDVEVARARERF